MQPYHLSVCSRQEIAETEPYVAALARLCGRQAMLLQFLVQRGQPGTTVPKNMVALRETGKIILGVFELVLVRPIKPDDDIIQIGHVA